MKPGKSKRKIRAAAAAAAVAAAERATGQSCRGALRVVLRFSSSDLPLPSRVISKKVQEPEPSPEKEAKEAGVRCLRIVV